MRGKMINTKRVVVINVNVQTQKLSGSRPEENRISTKRLRRRQNIKKCKAAKPLAEHKPFKQKLPNYFPINIHNHHKDLLYQ
jgi:hypothetical protein